MTHGVGTGCSRAKSMYGFAGLSRPSAPQSGQTARAGPQVACVNPTDLAGGSADLDPYFLTLTQVAPAGSSCQ